MVADELDPLQASELLSDAQFVDVREPYEWEAGHIGGSTHIPIGEIRSRWGEIEKDRPVVVVCQIGQRSDLVARFLRGEGYDAANLAGGLSAWTGSGLPLVSGTASGQIVDGWARDLDGNRLNPD